MELKIIRGFGYLNRLFSRAQELKALGTAVKSLRTDVKQQFRGTLTLLHCCYTTAAALQPTVQLTPQLASKTFTSKAETPTDAASLSARTPVRIHKISRGS